MSDKFKEACKNKKSYACEIPYIIGNKGFRRGVVSDNYYIPQTFQSYNKHDSNVLIHLISFFHIH